MTDDIVERLRSFSRRTLWKSDAADFAEAAAEIERLREYLNDIWDDASYQEGDWAYKLCGRIREILK